jgi:hypothetical protein
MKPLLAAAALVALVAPPSARSELKASAPDGFTVEHRLPIASPAVVAWFVLVHPERWWPKDHTWSGDPRNLSLDANAGGCFCERWQDASVEHARVIQSRPGRILRMNGALGPLQEMAVEGVLTVQLEDDEHGCVAIVTYRVSGDASHHLDLVAPVVDRVIGEQFGGFAALASRGGR